MSKKYSVQTQLIHNDHKIDHETGAVSIPIQHSSTYHQFSFDEFGKYDYGRSGNPTRKALEDTIAQLENGTHGFAFASGMAAVSTSLMLLSKGDHILVTDDVYGGTFRLITKVLTRFGIDHSFVDMTNLDEVEASIKENTKAFLVETPTNPLLQITDLKGICDIAKKHDCLTFVDNTFLSPTVQKPLDLGADVVIHSATKFLGGHSDVVAGLTVVKDQSLAEQLAFLQNSFGAVLGVQDSWLVLRGMKTLHVRLKQSSESALSVAHALNDHPKVEKVFYPGLKGHPGHDIHFRQAKSGGAVLSFRLKDRNAAKTIAENVELPVFAVSLGGVESILTYPQTMSHSGMPKEECEKRGISEGLLRLSVGLENSDELIADLYQALKLV